MITDEMSLLSRLGEVEPLSTDALERSEAVLREALASSGPGSDLERRRARRRGTQRGGRRFRRAVTASAAVVVAAVAVGGGSYLASGSSGVPTVTHRVAQKAPTAPLQQSRLIAYVGSSPTLAVTSLPRGYTLASSNHVTGPTKGFPGDELWSKTFAGPGTITIEEVTGANGTPDAVGLAAQNPESVQHLNVGGHSALLLNMNLTQGRPSSPSARIVGYVVYWQVGTHSWAMVSGGAPPTDLEQVAAGVLPAK